MRCVVLLLAATGLFGQSTESLASLSEKQARQVIGSMCVSGRVGSSLDFRVTSTDRSYNYKLRATWITPDVAMAAATLLKLSKGFTESDAQGVFHAVADREAWLVLVELDPREGSGVIPSDWLARFGAGGKQGLAVVGRQIGAEGVWKPLLSAFPRDYSYDAYLLEFSRTFEGAPVLRPADVEAELLVRIHNKQGHVRWKIPPDVR